MSSSVIFYFNNNNNNNNRAAPHCFSQLHLSILSQPVFRWSKFNPLKAKGVCFIRLSAYRAVNTRHVGLQNLSANDVQGKSPYRTLKRNVSAM